MATTDWLTEPPTRRAIDENRCRGCDDSMKTPQVLYDAADKALCQAKQGGRNRYSVYAERIRFQERESA